MRCCRFCEVASCAHLHWPPSAAGPYRGPIPLPSQSASVSFSAFGARAGLIIALIFLVLGSASLLVGHTLVSPIPIVAPEARAYSTYIPDHSGTHVDRHAHVRDLRYDDNKESTERSPEWLVRLRTRASTSFSFWGAYIDSRLWNSYPYARLDQFFFALLKTPGLLELLATKLSGSLGMTAVLAAGIASHTR